MTVHLWDSKLSYVSVPKCACTSLKLYFYELQHGRPFADAFFGEVHQEYRSRTFAFLPQGKIDDHVRVTVVREPVSRIVSAYHSKVVNEGCLKWKGVRSALSALGLSTEPSLTEFLRRLRTYILVSPMVYRHCQKLSYFLGKRPEWYTKIYDLSQVTQLREFVGEKIGRNAEMSFVNRSQQHSPEVHVSDADRSRIRTLYKDDVTLYGRHFATPA